MRYVTVLAALLMLAGCESKAGADAAATQPATRPTTMQDAGKLTEAQWKQRLSPEEYRVLREKGTERAFTGKLTDTFDPGTYYCAACGAELFHSDTKFHSGCGWPSFYQAAAGDRVKYNHDNSFGMVRTEVLCANCGSHLGHVFDDAPDQPTGQRFCINSVSLKFVPDPAAKK